MSPLQEKMDDNDATQKTLGGSSDARLSHWLYAHVGCKVPRSLLIWLEHSGNGLLWIPAALASSLSTPGHISTPNVWAANVLAALLLDLAAVGILKGLVRRARPSYNDSTDFLTVATVDSFSFPSGHTSRVVMLACLCWICFPGQIALCASVAVWAATVAVSRVALGRHFVTDVLGGLLLGLLVALAVTKGTWTMQSFVVSHEMLSAWRQRLFTVSTPVAPA